MRAPALLLAAALAACTPAPAAPLPLAAAAPAAIPALAVPRPDLTPGAVASTDPADVCSGPPSYTKRHRHTGAALKAAVRREYGIAGHFAGEIDHLVPLCLGGADTLANLWPQPAPGYHAKDRLEDRVCALVCRDHALPLAAGQALFLGDWRVAYRRIFGARP